LNLVFLKSGSSKGILKISLIECAVSSIVFISKIFKQLLGSGNKTDILFPSREISIYVTSLQLLTLFSHIGLNFSSLVYVKTLICKTVPKETSVVTKVFVGGLKANFEKCEISEL
jgi:hypothetical protein